jgi:DNA-directed RNA polymerase subunit RPC12/RpoP
MPCGGSSLTGWLMISFPCGNCNKQLKVNDELAGKKVKCPGCGHPVVVPALVTMQFDCPTCKKNLKAPDEKAGAKVKCPWCQTVFQVPSLAPEIAAKQISVSQTNSLGVIQNLAVLALRPLAGYACTALGIPGKDIVVKSVGHVVDFLADKFKDDSQRLSVALNNANDKAWKTIEVALAGESFWNRLVAKGEDSAFAQQIRTFLDSFAISPDVEGKPDFRQCCLEEIRAARKKGLLTGANYDASELARQTGAFARYVDPVGLLNAEWQFIGQLADGLEKEQYKNLASLLTQRPPQGMPLLVMGVRYYFRRAVEEDTKLFQGLAFAKLESLGDAQDKGIARLNLLGQAQEKGLAALFAAFAAQGQRLEGLLVDISEDVGEIKAGVKKLDSVPDDVRRIGDNLEVGITIPSY